MIIGCVIVYVDTPYFLFPHIVVTRRYTFLTEKFRLFPNNIVHYIGKFKNFFLTLQNAAKIIATEKQFSGDVDDLLKDWKQEGILTDGYDAVISRSLNLKVVIYSALPSAFPS